MFILEQLKMADMWFRKSEIFGALGSKHNFYHRICKDMIAIWMDKGASKFESKS